MPTKLISNKALRECSAVHVDAAQPLQDFRRKIEKGSFDNFAELRAVFPAVDKVADRFVFDIAGNKYRLVARMDFTHRRIFIKAVLTHREYDKEEWK